MGGRRRWGQNHMRACQVFDDVDAGSTTIRPAAAAALLMMIQSSPSGLCADTTFWQYCNLSSLFR